MISFLLIEFCRKFVFSKHAAELIMYREIVDSFPPTDVLSSNYCLYFGVFLNFCSVCYFKFYSV